MAVGVGEVGGGGRELLERLQPRGRRQHPAAAAARAAAHPAHLGRHGRGREVGRVAARRTPSAGGGLAGEVAVGAERRRAVPAGGRRAAAQQVRVDLVAVVALAAARGGGGGGGGAGGEGGRALGAPRALLAHRHAVRGEEGGEGEREAHARHQLDAVRDAHALQLLLEPLLAAARRLERLLQQPHRAVERAHLPPTRPQCSGVGGAPRARSARWDLHSARARACGGAERTSSAVDCSIAASRAARLARPSSSSLVVSSRRAAEVFSPVARARARGSDVSGAPSAGTHGNARRRARGARM